jgi:hypothetical protein
MDSSNVSTPHETRDASSTRGCRANQRPLDLLTTAPETNLV